MFAAGMRKGYEACAENGVVVAVKFWSGARIVVSVMPG